MPAIQFLSASAQAKAAPASKAETTTAKPDGVQAAFSSYMRQSSFNGAQMAKQQTASAVETQKTPNSKNSNVQQDFEQSQTKASVQAGKINNADNTGQNMDAKAADEVDEALQEAVETVKDLIKEELGVDDQQLEDAMELLGMAQTDLLIPQQLTALAVELTGSQDAGMMLFSEGFQNVLQQVSIVTEDLLQDLGITMEQLMEQVSQATSVEQPDTADVQLTPDSQPNPTGSADISAVVSQETATDTPMVDAAPVADTAPQEKVDTETPQAQEIQVQDNIGKEEQKEVETLQVQEEAEDMPQAQRTMQTEEDGQMGQQESEAFQNENMAALRNRQTQQDGQTAFEFHADARHAQPSDVPTANTPVSQAPQPQVNVEDMIRQITEYTRVHLTENIKSIEMQLNPANLGRIFLHVTEKAGTITAQLTAQDENVKEALVQQAAVLKDNLNQQGIKVDAVEVSVGTHEFESNLEKDARQQEEQARQQEEQSNRRSARNINLNELDDLEGLSGLMSEEEALVAQIMRDNGNNVDFKA